MKLSCFNVFRTIHKKSAHVRFIPSMKISERAPSHHGYILTVLLMRALRKNNTKSKSIMERNLIKNRFLKNQKKRSLQRPNHHIQLLWKLELTHSSKEETKGAQRAPVPPAPMRAGVSVALFQLHTSMKSLVLLDNFINKLFNDNLHNLIV